MTAAVTASPAAALLTTRAIRERTARVAQAVTAGRSSSFRIDRSRLPGAADLVADVTRRRYPDLAIPFHSRWRHFEAGGLDRRAQLEQALAGRSDAERARAYVDLTVVSVLLDAGAGAAWGYDEPESGQRFTRSEGLGVATFRAFMRGDFSASPGDPLRADAVALAAFDDERIRAIFAVTGRNPLVGVDGRAALMRRLGGALTTQGATFAGRARPGGLYDALVAARGGRVDADDLLSALLAGLAPVWPHGSTVEGVALGDTWRHPHAGGEGATAGWVPFHKLSQWLAYSLLEPFAWSGITIRGQDALTALPEYRNGGLLLDTGVLTLRDPGLARVAHAVGSELIVEWRALTIALIDELAPLVRQRLGRPDLRLACILEGGTWAAGRELAAQLRNGEPPLAIVSDGTVF